MATTVAAAASLDEILTGLDMTFWRRGRLETFGQWPFRAEKDACTAERMAAAGFFVVEGHDERDIAVECFVCNKQLDGWEPDDDPWQEHVKHQADCPYVLLNKPDELHWTVEELFLLTKDYCRRRGTRKIADVAKRLEAESRAMAETIPEIYRARRDGRKSEKRT